MAGEEGDVTLEQASAFWQSFFGSKVADTKYETKREEKEVQLVAGYHGITSGTPLDYWQARFGRHFTWYYPSFPAPALILSSLQHLLCLYPELASYLQYPDDFSSPSSSSTSESSSSIAPLSNKIPIIFNHLDNPHVKVEIVYFDDERYFNDKGIALPEDPQSSLLYDTLRQDLDLFSASTPTSALPFFPTSRVMTVRLNIFGTEENPKGGVLSVWLQHGVMDAGGAFQLIKDWASLARELASQKRGAEEYPARLTPVDRYQHIRRHLDLSQPVMTPEQIEQMEWFEYGTVGRMIRSWGSVTLQGVVGRRLVVTRQLVDQWKDYARQGAAADELAHLGILSTNDVISALMWRLFAFFTSKSASSSSSSSSSSETDPSSSAPSSAPSLDDDDEKPYPLTIVMNIREKLGEKSYLGNLVFHPRVPWTRKQVLASDFSQLCLAIRQAISRVTPTIAQESLRLLYERTEEGQPQRLMTLGTTPFRVFVTNWAKFPVFDVDFGSGSPSLFLRGGVPAGFLFALPHPSDPSATIWHFQLPAPLAELFDSLDFSSPASVFAAI